MKSVIIKLINLSLIVCLTFAWTGCQRETEEERQQKIQYLINEDIKTSEKFVNEKQYSKAITLLEDLHESFPEHPEVLEALAWVYSQMGDVALAGFYYEQSYLADTSHIEFALYAGEAYAKSENWETAIEYYRIYLNKESKDARAWKLLAYAYLSSGHPNLSLDAYVRGVELEEEEPDLEESRFIGRLSYEVKDYMKAKYWYNQALIQDPASAYALLGLVDVAIARKSYTQAEYYLKKLETALIPDAEAARLEQDKEILAKWKVEQEELEKSRLEKERLRLEEERAKAEAEKKAQEEAQRALAESEESNELGDGKVEPETESSKVPGSEVGTAGGGYVQKKPVSAIDYYKEASRLRRENKYKDAAKLYWKSLTIDDTDADVWYELAETYFENKQLRDAEMTALEAIRRNPKNILYTLLYLKIVQNERTPQYFMEELLKARANFPGSPEITLAVAKGYKDIAHNKHNALQLYELYLKQAPQSNQKAEVEKTIEQLKAETGK